MKMWTEVNHDMLYYDGVIIDQNDMFYIYVLDFRIWTEWESDTQAQMAWKSVLYHLPSFAEFRLAQLVSRKM
jgi:hypothetical protein